MGLNCFSKALQNSAKNSWCPRGFFRFSPLLEITRGGSIKSFQHPLTLRRKHARERATGERPAFVCVCGLMGFRHLSPKQLGGPKKKTGTAFENPTFFIIFSSPFQLQTNSYPVPFFPIPQPPQKSTSIHMEPQRTFFVFFNTEKNIQAALVACCFFFFFFLELGGKGGGATSIIDFCGEFWNKKSNFIQGVQFVKRGGVFFLKKLFYHYQYRLRKTYQMRREKLNNNRLLLVYFLLQLLNLPWDTTILSFHVSRSTAFSNIQGI